MLDVMIEGPGTAVRVEAIPVATYRWVQRSLEIAPGGAEEVRAGLDVLEEELERCIGECQKICARAVLSDIDEPFAEDDGELCFGLGECQKICARAVLSDIDEPFAEDDGELCFGLVPFPRRTFPRLGRMIENEI